jgi:leader peptidase (prepilin peptidase)/N-methyltransferase
MFVLGLCLGSFINVVIYRLPREDVSIGQPRRSQCPRCQAPIPWYDNLPVISYVLLLGRCRHCHQGISLRYPLVEIICGLLCLAVYMKSGLGLRFAAELYFVLALVAITYIDLDAMVIPDHLTVPGMILGVAAAGLAPDAGLVGVWAGSKLYGLGLHSGWMLSLAGSLLGLALGGGIIWVIYKGYFLIRGQEGIGGGDFTLLAMIGAFLGWRAVPVALFLGSIGALFAAVLMAMKEGGFSPQMKLPFGPFLSLAALIFLFFGERILIWYLG